MAAGEDGKKPENKQRRGETEKLEKENNEEYGMRGNERE